MFLAGYSHQNSFIKAKSLHGATCEEVIKTSGNQKIGRGGEALRFWSQPRLEDNDYTPAVWTRRKGAEGRHSSGGTTSPPWRSAFKLPIIEVRHGPERQM